MKKAIAILLVLVLSLSCLGMCVSADTGTHYHTIKAKNNSNVQIQNNYRWTTNATNRIVWWGDAKDEFSGTASAYWYGASPYNADNMSISNIIFCDKVLGTFSASLQGGTNGASGSLGFSCSSNSTSATYTYAVSNKWQMSVDFDYTARCGGLWLHCNYFFETTSVIQLGSSFYQLTTGQDTCY